MVAKQKKGKQPKRSGETSPPGERVPQRSHEQLARLLHVQGKDSAKERLLQLGRAERKAVYYGHPATNEPDRAASANYSVQLLHPRVEHDSAIGAAVREGGAKGHSVHFGSTATRKSRDEEIYAWYCAQKQHKSAKDEAVLARQGKGIVLRSGEKVVLTLRTLQRIKARMQNK